MYTCANCGGIACSDEQHRNMPQNCPMKDENRTIENTIAKYDKCDREFHIKSSSIEAEGYCIWPRLKETVVFCMKMNYEKIGLAFCRGLRKEAKIINKMLVDNGFEVVSVICKTGGVSKEIIGIPEDNKLKPNTYEPMCNPIEQAMLLNEQGTEFNIVVGLCVGHDSLFLKHSDAMSTVLIVKDRVLAHNPAAAVYCHDGYFKNRLV